MHLIVIIIITVVISGSVVVATVCMSGFVISHADSSQVMLRRLVNSDS